MTEKLATFSQEDDISIITLDDGKANVFSPTMINHIHGCLDKVPTEKGALIIAGREGMFSGGFDLKIISSGDMKLIQEMTISGFRLLVLVPQTPVGTNVSFPGITRHLPGFIEGGEVKHFDIFTRSPLHRAQEI